MKRAMNHKSWSTRRTEQRSTSRLGRTLQKGNTVRQMNLPAVAAVSVGAVKQVLADKDDEEEEVDLAARVRRRRSAMAS